MPHFRPDFSRPEVAKQDLIGYIKSMQCRHITPLVKKAIKPSHSTVTRQKLRTFLQISLASLVPWQPPARWSPYGALDRPYRCRTIVLRAPIGREGPQLYTATPSELKSV
eukprot:7242174-Pyramimonas_sp.AAC.2